MDTPTPSISSSYSTTSVIKGRMEPISAWYLSYLVLLLMQSPEISMKGETSSSPKLF